jgi:hypothetical protein
MAEGCEWKGYLCYEAGKAATCMATHERIPMANSGRLPAVSRSRIAGKKGSLLIVQSRGVKALQLRAILKVIVVTILHYEGMGVFVTGHHNY